MERYRTLDVVVALIALAIFVAALFFGHAQSVV